MEFHHRGNTYKYALVWIENAPKYKINTSREIIAIVDKYNTSEPSFLLLPLQEAQSHKYLQICKRKRQLICRFYYPLPPME